METLDVSGNKDMSEFPIVGTNSNMEHIDCHDTKIKSIPTGVKNQCPSLKDIRIYQDIIT